MADFKEILRNIAPTLGAALGGPMGGVAAKFLSEKLLGKSDVPTSELENIIESATPDQLATLKQIEIDFKLEMKKLDIDVFELEYKDRDSARKLFEVNVWPQIILSVLFVLGYFVVLYILMNDHGSISGENPAMMGVFTTVLGVLTAAIPQILAFWFGSSLGSKEKTQGLNLAAGKGMLK